MGLIYIIKNNCNDKVYVGQTTTSMKQRWNHHVTSAKNNLDSSMVLYNAMRKYGVENFYIELLEGNIVGTDLLNKREKHWIGYYNSLIPTGYNVREGGEDCGRREVYKIDLTTNDIVTKYDSLNQAAEENDINPSNLSKVCRGIECSCKGFKWSYVDEYDKEKIKNKKPKTLNRAIYQIDNKTGEIIKKFKNIAEAVRLTNVNQPTLSMCLNGKYRTANGYNWCYVDEYDKNTFITKSQFKKVLQLDKTTDKLIKEWGGAKEAAKAVGCYVGNIRAVCSGKHKTAKGYKWKYVE